MKLPLSVIAFDADDTLWVNEPNYRNAEKELERILKNYVDIQSITENLYKIEMKNLSLFGYGAKGFTISMIETAIELSGKKISAKEIQQIINLGKSVMNNPIELLPNVRKVVIQLSQICKLMLLTKGDLFDQESKIARSGLSEFFKYVEIMSEKDEETYTKILKKYSIDHDKFLMIGNSLKSDILPILSIGSKAVHIPYHTTWIHENVEQTDTNPEYYELSDIIELPDFIDKIFEIIE
jgi:putative hydrolase of the HAD superfamily